MQPEGTHRDHKGLKYQIADDVQCATDLRYKEKYIERIKQAKTENEIYRILYEARHNH